MSTREQKVVDNLEELFGILPIPVVKYLKHQPDVEDLFEVVLDLGRPPECRFPGRAVDLDLTVTREDIDFVVQRVGAFSDDNRAGIERTLHRISCMRNRQGQIIGLTCRVGRAIQGTIDLIRDLVESGRSILILGRPGIGKTTKLREIARVLSTDLRKRVIVIDTSNEIAGDGDIPHPGIGRARRMQVARSAEQHAVMIEAVENHMPEVIIIDEIGTELEAAAARTIAERGVQLIGTAHGNSLENLLVNPTLTDLVGGIQSVTLSDEEARRRGTQKSILERKAPPTFDICLELQDRDRIAVHPDVAEVVDHMLRGLAPNPEIRQMDASGQIKVVQEATVETGRTVETAPAHTGPRLRIYPFAVSRSQLERVIRSMRMHAEVTRSMSEAGAILVLKAYLKSAGGMLHEAEARGIPVHVVKSNTIPQIQKTLREVMQLDGPSNGDEDAAMREAREAVDLVLKTGKAVELMPRSAVVRRLQHQVIEKYGLVSESAGEEPHRRVLIHPLVPAGTEAV